MFKPKVLIVIGARQIGKTTMIEHFLATSGKIFLSINAEEPA
jgi:predicted AAA+ superfamily ATPase